jgi:hypothetical protein
MVSNESNSSLEDNIKVSGNYTMNLFVKLGEAFRKTRDEKPHNFLPSEKFYFV